MWNHGHGGLHVLAVPLRDHVAVDFALLCGLKLQLVDISVLVANNSVVLPVNVERLGQRHHVRPQLRHHLLEGPLNQVLRIGAEVAAGIKTLGVFLKHLQGKDFDAQLKSRSDVLIFELVLLNHLDGHQEHQVLNMRFDGPLDV